MSESNKFTPGPWVVSKDDSEIENALEALAHCRADIGYSSMQTRAAHTADKALKKARGQQ